MKVNLISIISALSHVVLYVTAVCFVVIAVFVSIIRWYPNLSDIIEAKVEARLSSILNADIVIESLDISPNKLLSEIIVQNIQITDRNDSDNVWRLDKAKIGINLHKSLLSRTLRIKEVSLEGLDLSLRRDAAGDVHINQLFLLPSSKMVPSGEEGTNNVNQYANVRLSLLDANIHWLDELTQTDYLFKEFDIAIDPTSRGHDVFISGDLPEILGKSLQANLRFEGNIREFNQSSLKFYAKTEQFRLSEIARRFVGDSGTKVPIAVDSEVWGEYSNNTLTSLLGSIDAQSIVESAESINQDLCLSDEYIQRVSMDFSWENLDRNWELFANNIEVISSKKDWPKSEVQFKLHRHSLNAKTILAHIGNINLGAVCNTLHAYSPHIVRFEDQLKDYRFNASIDDLFVRFDLSEGYQTSYQYAAQFSDASLWIAQGDQRIKGIGGVVSGGDASGRVRLNTSDLSVTLPDQFPGFDLKFAVRGDITWSHHGNKHVANTDSLHIYNEDLDLSARAYVHIEDQNIYLDSQAHINKGDASVVGDYFPLFEKTRTTKKWLTDSIHEGKVKTATALLRGNLQAFPFQKSSGQFQTSVEVQDGILEYKKEWPKLEQVQAKVSINKDRIKITSNQASTLNSRVKQVNINIDSFLRAVLNLEGTVDGPAADLLYFLGESNLVRKTNSVVDQIDLQGDSRLKLNFSRSLSRKIDYPPTASGKIHFLGNKMNILKAGLEINDIAGEVSFNNEGASSETVLANLYGQPATLTLSPKGEGASSLEFSGQFDLSEYIKENHPQYRNFFTGTAPVRGSLHLPSFFKKNNPDKLKLEIASDLQGVASSLPEPLNKTRDASANANLAFDQASNAMKLVVEDLIGVHFSLPAQQPFALRLIDLDASEDAVMPESGLAVTGKWNQLAPLPWMQAYKKYKDELIRTRKNSQSSEQTMPTINVEIDSLLLPQWPAKNLQLIAEQSDQQYVIDINSNLAQGIIKIPDDKNQAMIIDLNSLVLVSNAEDKNENSHATNKKPNTIDPRSLWPIIFNADKLNFMGANFSDVQVNSTINEQGMSFDEIKFSAQDMQASATGGWTILGDIHNTQFDFNIESIDFEDTLIDLGFKSGMKKGEARANGTFTWPAAPYQFELAQLEGLASFRIKDGSVSEVDPGNAGRLLALLNLGAISRRLSLDFKDVTNKGFSFDRIKGDLTLAAGGELSSDNISIRASAADIDMLGSTNLVNQTYNQTVFVTPAVSGTLPAAGAIVGGPIGAGIGIVVDQVAKGVGLNKVSKLEYKMTGTWEEPVIERVSRRKASSAPDTQGQGQPITN